MPRVICHLRNASHLINGVRFAELPDGGMLSEEISDDVAADFLAIRGYQPYAMPRSTPVHHEAATERSKRVTLTAQKENA